MDEIKSQLYQGNMIECTKDEYINGVRNAIQDFAGEMVDTGQDIRAIIALEEVKRLDKEHLDD